MNDEESNTADQKLKIAISAVVLVTLLLTAGVAYVFAVNQIGEWKVWEKPGSISGQQWFEHVRNAATLIGVPAVGSALVFSYFRQRTSDKAIDLTRKQMELTAQQLSLTQDQIKHAIDKDQREYVRGVRERFTLANSELAEENSLRQAGGVSTMISVANDFQAMQDEAGRQDCIDALLRLLQRLSGDSEKDAAARHLWATISARMAPTTSLATSWWDANLDLSTVGQPLGPMFGWVLTGGRKQINAVAISSPSTGVVQNTKLEGGELAIYMKGSEAPFGFINDEFVAGTLSIHFSMPIEGGYPFVYFADCTFGDVRLVLTERMAPAPKRILKFFRCTFMGSSFILPDDVAGYTLEFSQCVFHDFPLLEPLPEGRRPAIDTWDRNSFEGNVKNVRRDRPDASDFDLWSRTVTWPPDE